MTTATSGTLLANGSRIVIKIGSALLVDAATGKLRENWLATLAEDVALELLADAASREFHPLIGQAKDVAAGAVLVCAVGAAAAGLLVFAPHLLRLL